MCLHSGSWAPSCCFFELNRSLRQDLFREIAALRVFAGADDDLSKPSVAADETCIDWAEDKPCRSGMPTLGAHGARGGRTKMGK